MATALDEVLALVAPMLQRQLRGSIGKIPSSPLSTGNKRRNLSSASPLVRQGRALLPLSRLSFPTSLRWIKIPAKGTSKSSWSFHIGRTPRSSLIPTISIKNAVDQWYWPVLFSELRIACGSGRYGCKLVLGWRRCFRLNRPLSKNLLAD
jgi:hypothetical protein